MDPRIKEVADAFGESIDSGLAALDRVFPVGSPGADTYRDVARTCGVINRARLMKLGQLPEQSPSSPGPGAPVDDTAHRVRQSMSRVSPRHVTMRSDLRGVPDPLALPLPLTSSARPRLVSDTGVLHQQPVGGDGTPQPLTQLGFVLSQTTISGLPVQPDTIGPAQPARNFIGTPLTGPGGSPLRPQRRPGNLGPS